MSRTNREGSISSTRMLLIVGMLAGPVFTIVWLVTGSVRNGYDPIRNPISALSLGESGWTQIANFIATGLLTLVLAFSLRRVQRSRGGPAWLPILIAIVGIGFLGTGFFVTDPINGYPPGTPDLILPPTLPGFLHVVFASFIFALPLACLVVARFSHREGERSWAVYSSITAIVFVLIYLFAMAGFLQVDGLSDYAGLLQRISLIVILTWMTLLPIYLLKSTADIRNGQT